MYFQGKLAIFRRGVDIPPSSLRKEVYSQFNAHYDKFGFDIHMHNFDVPIVIMIKRTHWTKDRTDFLNYFRWEQQLGDIIFPKILPKRILLRKKEGDEIEIKQKDLSFRLTCCQLEAQTTNFRFHNGDVPFEQILAMEHKAKIIRR